jgi:hypothetical protein
MLKKLIERIDMVSDYVNPIVVRDMRRMVRCEQMHWSLMIYSCLLVVGCVLVYFLYDLDSLELYIYQFDRVHYFLWVFIWQYMHYCVIVVCFSHVSQNLDDEMFHITPITPRQYLHAYMFEMFIWTFLGISLFTPVVLIIFWQSPNFIMWTAIMLCDSVLAGQMITLVILPFIVRVKNSMQLFIVIICFVSVGWAFAIFIMPLEWELHSFILASTISKSPTAVLTDPLFFWSIIFFCIFVPIGSLLTIIPAYKLSLYALKTRKKSIVKMFLLNVFFIILASVVVTLICSGITFVVFSFL